MAKTESFRELAQKQVVDVSGAAVAKKQQTPQHRSFFGGTSPFVGASRPLGYAKVDENGQEISENVVSDDDDITNSEEFKAAFGDNEFVKDFVKNDQSKNGHKVEVVNIQQAPITDINAPIDIGRH